MGDTDVSFVVMVKTTENALRKNVEQGTLTNPLKLLVEGELEQWTCLRPQVVMQANNLLEALIQYQIENYTGNKNIKIDDEQLQSITKAVTEHEDIHNVINDIVEEEVGEIIELTTKHIRIDTTRDDYYKIAEFLSQNAIGWEEIEEPII